MHVLTLDSIRLDGGTQTRVGIEPAIVADYAEQMAAGAVFPPVIVFHDGTDYWLADGFHRVEAAKQAGCAEIAADIRDGSKRDAVLFSVSANAAHGLRRTNADKRRAVETVLRDSEWRDWSDREIARRPGVDHKTVSAVRSDLQRRGEIPVLRTSALVPAAGAPPVAVDLEYPVTVSADPDVEAARQIAVEIVGSYATAEALEGALLAGTYGNDDRALWHLGQADISLPGTAETVHVGRAQIGVRIATANGIGVYRFPARPLYQWIADRAALIQDPAAQKQAFQLYCSMHVDWNWRDRLAKAGLIVLDTLGPNLTAAGRAMAEEYIAADPFAKLEYDTYGKRRSYFIPGSLRDDMKSLYHRQKTAKQYTSSVHFNALQKFAARFVKDGLLHVVERPRVPRWAGERDTTCVFYAITAAGAEMLGLPALPDPAEPPDLPWHDGAKAFVPPDAAHIVAVGDPVRVGKRLARVHELRAWPELSVKYLGDHWHTNALATQVEPVVVEDDQPDPIALEEMNHAVEHVSDALRELRGDLLRWKSGPEDSLDGQTDTQAEALRLLAALSAVICKTHSAARIEMEPLEASVAPAGDPDDDEDYDDYEEDIDDVIYDEAEAE